MNEKIENFISHERQKGSSAGVFFDLKYSEKVHYGTIECNGFFESKYKIKNKEEPIPYLAVATKKSLEKWLPIFIHESSHMDQWLENSPLWLTSEDFMVLDDWLIGKDYPIEQIVQLVHQVILVEADCERRTIEKIKKYDLPIDIKYYAQRANAYLYYYQWVIQTRKWYKTAPYEVSDILYYMPKEIQDNSVYLKPLSEERVKLFDKCGVEINKK